MYARIFFANVCCCAFTAAVVSPACAAPADDQYAVAAGHYSLSRWELAVEEFEQFLTDYDDDSRAPLAHFYLAEALVQSHRHEEAATHFSTVRQSDADQDLAGRALFRLGEIAYLAGHDDQATAQLDQFRTDYPEDALGAYALPYLADMRLRADQPEQAEAIYSVALTRYPTGPLAAECRFGLARAIEARGGTEEAAQRYTQLAGEGPFAAEALLRLGRLQYQQQNYQAAGESLTRFRSEFAEHALRGDASYWQAMAHWQQGEYAQAVALLESALAEEPEHPLAPVMHYYAAEAQRDAGQPQQAGPHYEQVLRQWPASQWAEASLVASMEIALEQQEYSRVALLAQRHQQQYSQGELAAAVGRMQAAGLVRLEQYDEAAQLLAGLIADPATEAADQPAAARDLASTRYLLALAHLGAKRWEDALTALEGLSAPPGDTDGELAAGLPAARATALFELDRYEEAIQQFEAHLALAPSGAASDRSRAQLAVAHARLGQWPAAQEALESLAGGDASTTDGVASSSAGRELYLSTVQLLAQQALTDGESQRAVAWNQILAESAVEEFAAVGQRGLAWSQLAGHQQDASIESFEVFLRDHSEGPQAAEALLALAGLYERDQQAEKALASYQRLLAEHADSPEFPSALLGTARLYEESQRDAQAVELLERLIRDFPEFSKIDAALYRWAWLLDDLGQSEQADEKFERLYQAHPESSYWADACYRLAQRAAHAENYERAGQLADELVAKSPSGELAIHALYLRGQVAANRQDWTAATRDMQRLLAEYPESPLALPARYWLAEAHFHQQNTDEAVAAYEQVAAETAGRREGWLAMVELRRMQLAAKAQDWDQVERLAETTAQRFPDFAQQHKVDYLLGRALASQGRLNEARQAYQRVTGAPGAEGSETAAMAQWMIGETHFHQRQYEEAIRAYHRVELLYVFPRWQAAALLQAGKCHESLGRWSQALELYQRVVDGFEAGQFTAEAQERLQFVQQRAASATP